MESYNIENINTNKNNDKITKINELSLRERKEKVTKELINKELTTKQLCNLLFLDNTNEDLIFRYLISLNNDVVKKGKEVPSKKSIFVHININNNINDIHKMIIYYSNYLSINKFNELKHKIFENKNTGYRNISFKELLFNILSSIKQKNFEKYKYFLGILNVSTKQRKCNNQPFDTDNFEALYFYFCTLLLDQIENNKDNINAYFETLKSFISNINEIDGYMNSKNYKSEKEDIKKFLIIIFAILNLDVNNLENISRLAMILKPRSKEEKEHLISSALIKIKSQYGNTKAEEFIKEIKKCDNYCFFDYKLVGNKIEILEECYLYEKIMDDNVFKKYEKEIIDLLEIIYK